MENKTLFGPPQKGSRIRTVAILSTRTSDPFIEKYYLIIVVFSCPHFSIYDTFYTLENTQSFNERDTHFKVGWLVVFNVPSTARSFRDGTPIYCPLRRT